MREPLVAEVEVAAVSACSELGLCVRVRELLLPVEKLDAEAALRVVVAIRCLIAFYAIPEACC